MAGSVTRRGLDMTGFVFELRGMCVVLGYPHGVDYQARPLPDQEGDDAEPHAAWEVTAVILTGSRVDFVGSHRGWRFFPRRLPERRSPRHRHSSPALPGRVAALALPLPPSSRRSPRLRHLPGC